MDYKNIFRPTSVEKFKVHTKLNQNVGLLRIFPSITTDTVSIDKNAGSIFHLADNKALLHIQNK